MIPTFIFTLWLLSLLSVGLLAGAIYLGHEWYSRSWGWDEAAQRSAFTPHLGWNAPTAMLTGAILLAVVVLFGGPILKAIMRMMKRSVDDPLRAALAPVTEQRLTRPDGTELRTRTFGRPGAPMLVLTHGWGFDSDEWIYAIRELGMDFRVVVWDEPGLGKSTEPRNHDFSLEKMAHDLQAVVEAAGKSPVILVGHSIGGMIILTFCRLFPQSLRSRVAGLVLTHTTYTNPVRTTKGAAFLSAIEKPVLVPLLYLTILFSPLLRLLSWMSYRNGTAHLNTMKGSFAGTESWAQIEFATRFQLKARPAVIARGMLGMLRYDATATLKTISVPTLVFAGDRDTTCKPEASEFMQREIPDARLVTLSPARHLGLLEHHKRYAERVQEFVRTRATVVPLVKAAA